MILSLIRKLSFVVSVVVAVAMPGLSAQAGERLVLGLTTELQPAMQQLIAEFRKQSGDTEFSLMSGSSRSLYADIRRGVPIDLFFAANLSYPARLSDEGLAAAAPVVYARNELLLWTLLPGTAVPTLDMLSERRVHVVAIPSRYSSPFGQRAEQALREAHVWPKLQAKLVTGDNVLEVARFVKNGSASIGIVTRSVLYRSEFAGLGTSAPIAAEYYRPIAQAFVITRHGSANPSAQAFAHFMTSAAARAILERHGYLPPNDAETAAK